jgi:U6 snRNA-associated Sm-like protein LSm7
MSQTKKVPPKKESILELQKLMDSTVRVKCVGGRELKGVLKGYDELVNLVLEDCDEFLRGKKCNSDTLHSVHLYSYPASYLLKILMIWNG